MAFPADEKDLEVCVAYGANLATPPPSLSYSNNLAATYVRPRLTISRGRIEGASRPTPTSIKFDLKNPAGVFSPRNIAGPNYGRLRRNTPVRVRVDPGGGKVTRGIAYLPDWPVRWTGPDIDDRIAMQAAGALRRIGTDKVAKSAPRRWLPSTSPVASWPLEDGQLADVGTPDVGDYPLQPAPDFDSPPKWGSGSLAPWLPSVLALKSNTGENTARWAQVVMPTFTTTWTIDLYLAADRDCDQVLIHVNPLWLPYGETYWQSLSLGGTYIRLSLDEYPETDFLVPQLHDGRLHHLRWTMSQAGPNTHAEVWVDGVSVATLTSTAVKTLQPIRTIGLVAENTGDTGNGPVNIGHLAAWTTPPTLADAVLVCQGWAGEKAADRFQRLCDEEGIPCDVAAGDSEAMGPQSTNPIPDLLQECADADEGTMIERLTGELGFDPRSSRYNRAVTMTVNYLRQIASLEPDDDDRDLVNYATVTRAYGATRTYERTDGPLGTDPATGVERYPLPFTRSLLTDDQALQHASYLVAKGTVDEPRFVVGINLRAHPELIPQWLACDIGHRIQVTNPPAIQVGPAPLDLVIEGYTELLDSVEWFITLWCEPYRINESYQVETGTNNRSRIPAGVSTLGIAYNATATSLSVTSATVRWIDSASFASQFPILIEIAGEVMTCTAIVGTGLTQTFTVARGLHGVSKALPTGSAVQLWRAPVIAL